MIDRDKKMKGIILAAGTGSRLRPLTSVTNKHLLPIYDKPMIFYALSTAMLAGLRDLLIIVNPDQIDSFRRLLGDGERYGITLSYRTQDRPNGLPDAYILGEKFLGGAPSMMILGDNFFHGQGLTGSLQVSDRSQGAQVFLFYVDNPRPYGVAILDDSGGVSSVVEKPSEVVSNFAITGLYVFDERASEVAHTLIPSSRGELEITDMIRWYLEDGSLEANQLGRGVTWLDMGTVDRLKAASTYVQLVQQHSNLKVCVPEEVAFRQGWIDESLLAKSQRLFSGSDYGDYLNKLPTLL